MGRLDNPLYIEDLNRAIAGIDLSAIDGARFMVSGATGMVGTFLIDALLAQAANGDLNCEIVALGRSEAKARERLPYFDNAHFIFEELDVSRPGLTLETEADVILHFASTTHPRAYATYPVGTISSNVVGLLNLLEHANKSGRSRFVFASSVEVYGENRGDVKDCAEDYCGYINCNTLRAGYPEAKRVGEALCQAYRFERGQEVFIPRLPRTFGPTLLPSDTKAISQFIGKVIAGEDVVLKSKGDQCYSYLYVADVVRALLWMLSRGLSSDAYNLASAGFDVSLAELASRLAAIGGSKVVFELPDEIERAGYSTATRATMDGGRIAQTGWEPLYNLDEALERTVSILREA